jgi:hypothetical protein
MTWTAPSGRKVKMKNDSTIVACELVWPLDSEESTLMGCPVIREAAGTSSQTSPETENPEEGPDR